MPPKRMTANPTRPARHFAGKAASSSSESDSGDNSDAEPSTTNSATAPKTRTVTAPPKVSGPGKIISTGEASAARKAAAAAAQELADVERQAREAGFVTESEDHGSGESGSGEAQERSSSEADDSSSEEDERRRRPVMARPKFLSHAARAAAAAQAPACPTAPAPEPDAAALRRAEADALVEAQIQKDLAARSAGKKHWDDADDEDADDVDDTDDVDPAAEYAAWRLREIKRLVRAREAIQVRERDIAERERRQALTEEERRAEDEALVAAQRVEKEGRGKMGYLQKYFHKGAFYQAETAALGLDKRDLAGARFADAVQHQELLPAALQMRDMTKLGKKGASKYRDLQTEDTGSWGRFDDPTRDRPGAPWARYGGEAGDDRRRGGGAADDGGGSAANALPLGPRKERTEPLKEGRRGGDSYRRDRSRSPRPTDRSRSRSRSHRRHRDHKDGRKRDYSRERDSHGDDKRRRVDAR